MEEMRDFTEQTSRDYREFSSTTYIKTGKKILTDNKYEFTLTATDNKKSSTSSTC